MNTDPTHLRHAPSLAGVSTLSLGYRFSPETWMKCKPFGHHHRRHRCCCCCCCTHNFYFKVKHFQKCSKRGSKSIAISNVTPEEY